MSTTTTAGGVVPGAREEDSALIPPRDAEVLRSPPTDHELLDGPLLASDESHHDTGAIVSLEHVHKTYLLGVEGVPALRGVSLSVRRGEFLMIIGASGGGKSSLLNVIGTIDRPTKGNVHVCGLRITSRTSDADLAHLRLRSLGFVFQSFNLLPSMTAIENVEMPMTLAGVPPSVRRKRATELLTRVGLSARLTHYPSMLSGGEQQRVTIARALANSPELVIADEPTGDLSGQSRGAVMRLLLELSESEGITVVMVTHDMELACLADRVVRIRDGKITAVTTNDPRDKADARRDIMLGTEEFRAGEDTRDANDPAASQSRFAEVVTERRPPEYYASYRHHLQRKGERAENAAERAALRSRGQVTGAASPSLVHASYEPPRVAVPRANRAHVGGSDGRRSSDSHETSSSGSTSRARDEVSII